MAAMTLAERAAMIILKRCVFYILAYLLYFSIGSNYSIFTGYKIESKEINSEYEYQIFHPTKVNILEKGKTGPSTKIGE
jgi:hypothetical protein